VADVRASEIIGAGEGGRYRLRAAPPRLYPPPCAAPSVIPRSLRALSLRHNERPTATISGKDFSFSGFKRASPVSPVRRG